MSDTENEEPKVKKRTKKQIASSNNLVKARMKKLEQLKAMRDANNEKKQQKASSSSQSYEISDDSSSDSDSSSESEEDEPILYVKKGKPKKETKTVSLKKGKAPQEDDRLERLSAMVEQLTKQNKKMKKKDQKGRNKRKTVVKVINQTQSAPKPTNASNALQRKILNF